VTLGQPWERGGATIRRPTDCPYADTTMDSARWEKVQTLFHEALELPEADRRDFLEAQCKGDPGLVGDVLVLIDEDTRGDSLLDRDIAQAADLVFNESSAASLPFKEFGPYQIIRQLGEGGMGAVYLAARTDLGNLVALKILREAWASPARRQRFESEQRTLAQLNHPGIARLYDADITPDGSPFFVMEYVDGVPLTEYCRERDCSVEERLKLYRAVCDAVEYAHQHAVIHRDLKPSNILVRADGSVRLLDFGIAKQIDAGTQASNLTRTGMHLLTPAYASPEQIRGEAVAVASDVYSLGVILYELLAGRLPFDLSQKTPAEAANLITTEDPVKPSAMARQSMGNRATRTASWADLDVLCLTAMHKERRRRYASVKALIGDLDHYLKQEPLEAHPDSPLYVAAKFLRRNWAAVSVAALVAGLLLFVGSLALTLGGNGAAVKTPPRTVAVLPFANAGSDHSMDFLGSAIPDEIARVLGRAHSLTVRPFDPGRAQTDPRKAARELGASSVVTGRFVKEGDQLQVTIDALDVETSHSLWLDAFTIPAGNTLRLEGEIASRTRSGLGPNLGAREFTLASLLRADMALESSTRPKNQQAYDLFLRAMSAGNAPGDWKQPRAMLEQSLALDPGYAPAWASLSGFCQGESWYSGGGAEAAQCAMNAAKRAAALDPDNVWTLASHRDRDRRQSRGDGLSRGSRSGTAAAREFESAFFFKLCAALRGVARRIREGVQHGPDARSPILRSANLRDRVSAARRLPAGARFSAPRSGIGVGKSSLHGRSAARGQGNGSAAGRAGHGARLGGVSGFVRLPGAPSGERDCGNGACHETRVRSRNELLCSGAPGVRGAARRGVAHVARGDYGRVLRLSRH